MLALRARAAAASTFGSSSSSCCLPQRAGRGATLLGRYPATPSATLVPTRAAAASSSMAPSEATIVFEPKNGLPATASVIFLHGLGDTGRGWEQAMLALSKSLPHTRFLMPTAPLRPVTRFGGMASTAWFDLVGAEDRAKEPCTGIEEARAGVEALIEGEAAKGVPRGRVILGGFSMGAGLTYFTGLQSSEPLAGLVVLSGYLPRRGAVEITQTGSPVLQMHGNADSMVLLEWGQQARAAAEEAGCSVEFYEYDGLDHSVTEQELQVLTRWAQERLPPV